MKILDSGSLQLMAAAKAIEASQSKGKVTGVVVDGETVEIEKAIETLRNPPPTPERERPSRVDRWVESMGARAAGLESRLNGTSIGRKVSDVIQTDQERVFRRSQVEVRFEDGHSETLNVEVVDQAATEWLNRAAIASEALSLVPAGIVVTIVSALAARAGAALTKNSHPEFSAALQRASLKQWLLASTDIVPGGSIAGGILMLAHDANDRAANFAAPPVKVIA